jgi:hypothetical protein
MEIITGGIEEQVLLSPLDEHEKQELIAVFRGEKTPSITSDVIAKHVLSPDVYPERLDYILQRVMNDKELEVAHSASNEGQLQNLYSKKVITDIPAWLKDHRLSDLEIQVAAQEYIFGRTEIYASNMLMIQYSVWKGHHKGEISYSNIDGVIIVVLMKNSPKVFSEFESKRYIHRITRAYADSGMEFDVLRKMAFVQLDKALDEFINDTYEDDEDLELLQFLAMMADPNNVKVRQSVINNKMLKDICDEALEFSRDKEVQAMLLAEKMAVADWNSNRTAGREELNALYVWLHEQKRDDDLFKALNDATFRQTLFDEYDRHHVSKP